MSPDEDGPGGVAKRGISMIVSPYPVDHVLPESIYGYNLALRERERVVGGEGGVRVRSPAAGASSAARDSPTRGAGVPTADVPAALLEVLAGAPVSPDDGQMHVLRPFNQSRLSFRRW